MGIVGYAFVVWGMVAGYIDEPVLGVRKFATARCVVGYVFVVEG